MRLTRDPARAEHLSGLAEVVTGDVRRRASLQPAVAGSDMVVSLVHDFVGPGRVTPRSVDDRGNANLVDLAAAEGASVVLMSVVGAAADSLLELNRAKHAAEARLRASGAPWTIVRSTPFLESWVEILKKGLIFGRGDNPVTFVSVHDVASTLARVVVEPKWRGRVVEIGGEDLTFNQLAALIQELEPERRRVRHIPTGMLRAMAPLVRPARAALVMDTTDMRFTVGAKNEGLPSTDLRSALRAALQEEQRK